MEYFNSSALRCDFVVAHLQVIVNSVGTQSYPTNFRKIVLWGQNGIALSTVPSAFSSTNQIFIFLIAAGKRSLLFASRPLRFANRAPDTKFISRL